MKKIIALNQLASQLVGDGRNPNVYFVTDGGQVQTVTLDIDVANAHWGKLRNRSPLQECAVEDRHVGVLRSVEPEEDDTGKLVIRE